MTDVNALKRVLSNLLEIAQFRDETITRLEMEITQLRKEITYASRCVPKKAMRKIIDFALATGYPDEWDIDEVAAYLDTLEE